MTIALTTPRTWVTGDTPTAALFNTYIRDNGDYFTGEVAWTDATLANGWVTWGTPYPTPGFRKIGDQVFLRGLIKSGTIGLAAFTLPLGYRPIAEIAPAVL